MTQTEIIHSDKAYHSVITLLSTLLFPRRPLTIQTTCTSTAISTGRDEKSCSQPAKTGYVFAHVNSESVKDIL
jgi:hypothetical protein